MCVCVCVCVCVVNCISQFLSQFNGLAMVTHLSYHSPPIDDRGSCSKDQRGREDEELAQYIFFHGLPYYGVHQQQRGRVLQHKGMYRCI